MTKTETEIAQKNVKEYKKLSKDPLKLKVGYQLVICLSNLQSCQRFKEFLEDKKRQVYDFEDDVTNGLGQDRYDLSFEDKIKDLKSAIKTYGDAGIK